jgi:hypothetical protein
MRNVAQLIWMSLPVAIVTSGCSGSGGIIPSPVGGENGIGGSNVGGASSNAGGQTAGGTTVHTGGTSSGGGATATGGSNATGGTTSNGGSVSGGGTQSVGGTVSTGGTGTKATGGKSSTSSSQPTGGKSSTGGSPAIGGTTSAGGATATGGTKASTGGTGTKATGGNTGATGGTGTKATGGNSSTGGTTTSGGSASFKCANLSMAPNTTGSKPAGAVGGLKVLDWAGFKGAVSFSFDDNMTTGSYTKFQATGAHVTLYVTAAMGNYAGYTGAPSHGDEIGNHTTSHTSNGSVSDFQSMQATIQSSYGVTGYTGASPNGSTTWSTPAQSFFIANRGTGGNAMAPRSSPDMFSLPSYLPPQGASSATMSGQINSGTWTVFCVHGWASPAYQPVNESDMLATMTKAVTDGFWAESVMNIAAYFLGQKAISSSATTTATWSLPAHFPPNMCVRVTTTGGTVTQKGAEVPFDSHGYYQISLDSLEVTIK